MKSIFLVIFQIGILINLNAQINADVNVTKDGRPIINLAYLELCNNQGHVHISIENKHIEDASSVTIIPQWDRIPRSLLKTANGWEIELYYVPVREENIMFDVAVNGRNPQNGSYRHQKTDQGIISVSRHLDKAIADYQKNRSNDLITTYFCGKAISTVELLAFFQDYLELSNEETCSLLARYNQLITLQFINNISYLETSIICDQFEDFILEGIGGDGDGPGGGNAPNPCLCKVISTNRAAYFLDNPGVGFNADGCSDTPAIKDCRQFEFQSSDDDLLVSYGRLGAAKSATMAMQYDGCDDSPNDFSYRLRASGAAIAFRSVCVDPQTLSGALTNCQGCIKEISLSYSYASEGEIYASAGNNLACTGEAIELTAEDWAFLMVTQDAFTTTIDTGGRKLYANCGNDSPSLDSLITKGSEIVNDLSGLLTDFSVGGLASAASAVTSFIMNEVFVAPCQTLQIDNYSLLAGSNKIFELAPGGYFEANMVSGVKFAGEAENVGKGFVTINGDFYMHAVLRTKVPEDGIIPAYCTCEKIGAYVLGSLKEETPKTCDIKDNENNLPIDMRKIFIYSPRSIQQLQNIAGVKLGLEGPWAPKWDNNGGCCTTVDLNCLAECAYISEPCPGVQPRKEFTKDSFQNMTPILSVFPNPANQVLYIPSPYKASSGTLKIYSSAGQQLFSQYMDEWENTIHVDLETYPPGVYFVQYQTSVGKMLTSKFIKQ